MKPEGDNLNDKHKTSTQTKGGAIPRERSPQTLPGWIQNKNKTG